MSFFGGKRKSKRFPEREIIKYEEPQPGEGTFEVDYIDNTVILWRWSNDRTEKIHAGHVRYDPEHNKIELKLSFVTVHLDIVAAKMFFGAVSELVEHVRGEITRGKKPREIKWIKSH